MRLFLKVVFSAAASLGSAGGVEVWSAADLHGLAGKLAPAAAAQKIAGKTLGAYGNHSASLWRRSTSGEAELHRIKTDLIVVEEGSATLVFGGSIPGSRATAPNEIRGKSIVGGESRALRTGDIVRIPAGTPHQFLLEKGEQVAYFALKIAR